MAWYLKEIVSQNKIIQFGSVYDRLYQEDAMHSLANRFVSSEREREVGYTTANLSIRQICFDPTSSFNKVNRICSRIGVNSKSVRSRARPVE